MPDLPIEDGTSLSKQPLTEPVFLDLTGNQSVIPSSQGDEFLRGLVPREEDMVKAKVAESIVDERYGFLPSVEIDGADYFPVMTINLPSDPEDGQIPMSVVLISEEGIFRQYPTTKCPPEMCNRWENLLGSKAVIRFPDVKNEHIVLKQAQLGGRKT